MSIVADYLREQAQQHPGLRLYNDLCDKCEIAKAHGKPAQLALIGRESLRLMEEYLTQANRRPMTLQEAGFGGGVPHLLDETNPRRLAVLIEF